VGGSLSAFVHWEVPTHRRCRVIGVRTRLYLVQFRRSRLHDRKTGAPDAARLFGVPFFGDLRSTSAFEALDPIPQFKATANLGEFLETPLSQSF
jgi:hypothetical protein